MTLNFFQNLDSNISLHCHLKDNLVILMITFSIKNVKAVWSCPYTTSPLSRGRGDHKLMIHNQTTLITWGRVGGGQNLGIKSWRSNIWMAPTCLLSGIYVRFMSFGQGVECQTFVIVIFFSCGQVLQFKAHSR